MTTSAVPALILALVLLGGRASNGPAVGTSPSAQASTPARASSGLGPDAEEPIVKVAGHPLDAAPPAMQTNCRRAQARVRFRLLCPTLLPHAGDGTKPRTYAVWADSPKATRADWLYVGAGYSVANDPEHWEWNNPNLFLHFFVYEGKLSPRLLDLSGTDYPQKLIGARTIGVRRGKLYEQVSYDLCGCGFGGHYTFLWRERGTTYAASLHRWLPRPTLRVLEALILHLKPL
jgi:hypothetical protein